ncbi:MAG: DUF4476 domain-containing protein [Bacteroidia bacterium]|nr:DUF4476 domain-containing protein [Bacteroidia bacterium]
MASSGLFILLIILSGNTNAEKDHRKKSSLKLLLPHTSNYTVVFDNVKYFDINECFNIGNLQHGNHRIKIIELIERRSRVIKRVVIFNGTINIPKNSRVWAKISHHGRLRIDRIMHSEYRGKGNRNNYYYEKNNDYDEYYNDDDYNQNRESDYYDNDWNSFENENLKDDAYYNYNYNNDNNDKKSFGIALSSIKNQSFDSERLKIAKNTVKQQKLNSEQILEIIKLFSFESSRLEFAKFAYNYTIDKKNYNVISSAFQFSSSTSELQDYIESQN